MAEVKATVLEEPSAPKSHFKDGYGDFCLTYRRDHCMGCTRSSYRSSPISERLRARRERKDRRRKEKAGDLDEEPALPTVSLNVTTAVR